MLGQASEATAVFGCVGLVALCNQLLRVDGTMDGVKCNAEEEKSRIQKRLMNFYFTRLK